MTDTSFVFWLGRIRKVLRAEFEARAEALEITAAQFPVLWRLWQGDGVLTSTLTRDCASDGGTITGVLDRLEGKGLIRRERCAEDRRAVRVFLTPAGRDLEVPLMEILSVVNEQALEGLSREERATLVRLLEQVGGNLGAK